jgi:hypothetical protein
MNIENATRNQNTRTKVSPPTALEWREAERRGHAKITGDELREIRAAVRTGIQAKTGTATGTVVKLNLRIIDLENQIANIKAGEMARVAK